MKILKNGKFQDPTPEEARAIEGMRQMSEGMPYIIFLVIIMVLWGILHDTIKHLIWRE
jgi:hypothetical protein